MGNHKFIIVDTKYGKCRARHDHINAGHIPTIQTAINKNEYFINQARLIHGEKYDYSKIKYINSSTRINILCKKHGVFTLTPSQHINRGDGCIKCTRECASNRLLMQDDIINRFISVHGNKYDYSKVVYRGMNKNVAIICREHGEFKQTPKTHTKSGGCPKCRNKKISEYMSVNSTGWDIDRWKKQAIKSNKFDSFKVYLIKVYDNNECFIKVGRTYSEIKKRFRIKYFLPYNYQIINVFVGSPEDVFNLEYIIKNRFNGFIYTPKLKFNGMHECFVIEKLDDINNFMNQTKPEKDNLLMSIAR